MCTCLFIIDVPCPQDADADSRKMVAKSATDWNDVFMIAVVVDYFADIY
jgi:hypothetical protein